MCVQHQPSDSTAGLPGAFVADGIQQPYRIVLLQVVIVLVQETLYGNPDGVAKHNANKCAHDSKNGGILCQVLRIGVKHELMWGGT